jgi:recombination protein RecR
MYSLPGSVQKLIDLFNRLPGIGPKSSARLVFHILYSPESFSTEFADVLKNLKSQITFCKQCHNLAEGTELCSICADTERNQAEIMVVEDVLDLFAFEQINEYKGTYHVLGGLISPVQGVGPEDINIKSLLSRVKKLPDCELIIATNPNLEGEATGMFIKEELAKSPNVNFTRLARGIPTGADLDYADRMTLKRALSGRTSF